VHQVMNWTMSVRTNIVGVLQVFLLGWMSHFLWQQLA
jgi:hypothetical protein